MDKIVETYNPYNQNVERRSSQLPGYINETFINSVEIRSPFIAGNKGYIGGTLQVGQNGIKIDGNAKTISSTNYIENTSGWIINGDGNAQFNNITARGTFILSSGESVEDAIDNIDVSWTALSGKPNVLANAAVSTPTPSGTGFQLTATHMGYYSGGQWKTYMKNDGTFGLSGSSPTNYLTWDGTTLEVRGNIQATSATFNYAGSSTPGGNANDTNAVNGVSSSTISQGAGRANAALNASNQYQQWLSSGTMALATLGSTGVFIGSQGIYGRAGGVDTFYINSSTGSAYFRGDIGASNIVAGSTITSNGIIRGGTIETSNTGTFVRIYGGTSGKIDFNFAEVNYARFRALQQTLPILGIRNTIYLERSGGDVLLAVAGDIYVNKGVYINNTGRMKLPVGTNLY